MVYGFFFQNAPKPKKKIKDLYDLNGTIPYKTEEIVPGKLWEITYTFENSARFDEDAKNEMKAFGMDYSSETCITKILEGAASHGENVVETAKKDIQIALEWAEKKTFTDTEMLEGYDNKLKTFVVKLNNGNLLLYAPVQIRDEVGFGTWIESLGKVEWIIVASCYHTLHLQNVLERYILQWLCSHGCTSKIMGSKPPMVFPHRSEIYLYSKNHAYQFASLNESRRCLA